jgi:hypothetical protein
MDQVIQDLETRKNGDKYHDFVIDDALYYIKKAQETLDQGLLNPIGWYENEQVNSKTFFSLFPQIYLTQQRFASDTGSSQNPNCPISNP